MTLGKIVGLLAAAVTGGLLLAASAGTASAQATRTWVSGVGDDANPCSRTAPCKTFAGAISKTAAAGEINVLDPGGFGGVTITKSISIIADHVEAGVLVSGTNAIVVNLPTATDKVVLEGLDIEGVGTGLNGVNMIGQGRLFIKRCSIRGFATSGINMAGASGSPAPRFVIQDSYVVGNVGGINIAGAGGAVNNGEILNTLIDNNSSYGLKVDNGGVAVLSASVLTGGPNTTQIVGTGQILSYGNNLIRNGTATLTPQTLQ